MPQASNFYTVLTSVQAVIQSLNLTDWNNSPVPVVVRKTSAYRQVVDAAAKPPVIYVSRWRKEKVQPKVFGDVVWVVYPVLITALTAGNQDLNAHIDYYLQWREELRQAFQSPTLAGASGLIWDTNMLPETLLDEAAIQKNWDVELLTVEFRSQERRLRT